jgi:hypothetical protein
VVDLEHDQRDAPEKDLRLAHRRTLAAPKVPCQWAVRLIFGSDRSQRLSVFGEVLGVFDVALVDRPGREVVRLDADDAFVFDAPFLGRPRRPLVVALDRLFVALPPPLLEPGTDAYSWSLRALSR